MICDGVDYLTTILSGVYVSTERSFAKWHVNDLDNGIGYRGDVRIRRCSGGKAFLDLISESMMRARVIFDSPRLVVWGTGVLEVICT